MILRQLVLRHENETRHPRLRGEQVVVALIGAALRDVRITDSRADLALIATALDAKQFDKALAAIDRLEAKMPKEPMPSNLRGLASLGRGDPAGARKSFERALTLSPDYLPATVNLARMDMADRKPVDWATAELLAFGALVS